MEKIKLDREAGRENQLIKIRRVNPLCHSHTSSLPFVQHVSTHRARPQRPTTTTSLQGEGERVDRKKKHLFSKEARKLLQCQP